MRNTIVPVFLLVFSSASYAALGGAPLVRPAAEAGKSVHVARMLAAKTAIPYTQVETILPSGTVLREYVAADEVVFAVSWKGPFLPDFREVLGQKHFSTMVAEAGKTPKAGHSQLTVKRPEVVIFAGGHMRAFEGKAWVPSALPPGFTPADIN